MQTIRADGAVALRNASAKDRAAVEALLRGHKLPIAGVPADLGGFLVAEAAGEVVGVIGLEEWGGYGLLRSAAVAEEWKGQGIGRRLVARLVAEAEAKGLRALYLLTTTAEGYFPEFGFAQTARAEVPEPLRASVEFQGACPASAVVMVRPLGTSGGASA